MASAAVTRRPVGRWRYSLGPCALLSGSEHARDDELRVGEALAEHAHERDRPALAEGPRRGAEGRLRGSIQRRVEPGRERRGVPARPGLPSAERHPGAVRRVGREGGADGGQRGVGVAGGRQAEGELQRGRWPQDVAGARRRRAVRRRPTTLRVGRQVWLRICSTGSSTTGRAPGTKRKLEACTGVDSAVSSAWRRRSSGMVTWRSARRISPVVASSKRSSSWRTIRNVLGTTPLAAPEWTPSSRMSTVSVPPASPRSDVVTHSRS